MQTTGNRERYTRQFTFSSMLECGYCGHKLSRRTRHQTTTTKKAVWQCMNATKNGIDSCPNCKAVDEVIVEGAFLEAFRLLADNFDDVMESVLSTIEDVLNDDDGNPTPYKLTFVLKCNQELKVDNAKAEYREKQKGEKVS